MTPSPRHFLGTVVVEQEDGWWILRKPIAYEDAENSIKIKVPRGFITDFASIPRVFWNIASPADYKYAAASIVHDRLYETHETSRWLADDIFYDAMTVNGTPKWKRFLMWLAVRIGGGLAYRSGPRRQVVRRAVDAQRKRRKVVRIK